MIARARPRVIQQAAHAILAEHAAIERRPPEEHGFHRRQQLLTHPRREVVVWRKPYTFMRFNRVFILSSANSTVGDALPGAPVFELRTRSSAALPDSVIVR